jgi:hypothetical protein
MRDRSPLDSWLARRWRPLLSGAGTILGPWGSPSTSFRLPPAVADAYAFQEDWWAVKQDFTDVLAFHRTLDIHPEQQRLFEPDEVSEIGR